MAEEKMEQKNQQNKKNQQGNGSQQQNKGNQQGNVNQQIQVRRDKLKELQEAGKDPFRITKYEVSHHSSDIREQYDQLEGKNVSLAGRMMFKRVMGKASF